jgi:hypothetical protein
MVMTQCKMRVRLGASNNPASTLKSLDTHYYTKRIGNFTQTGRYVFVPSIDVNFSHAFVELRVVSSLPVLDSHHHCISNPAIGAELTKKDIIETTLRAMHASADPAAPEYDEELVAVLQERVPDGDSKTCEEYKNLGVECCDLPEGGTAWICCAVRSELFPEAEVDESEPELKLQEWVRAGNKLGDYCGYVPPDLAQKIFDFGLLDEEVSEDGQVPDPDHEL